MGIKKKKSGKTKRQLQHQGHYCKICGEYKANENFSGRGHAAHICKACASKSPAQKSEDITINRLHGMAFRYLNETEIKWLKNRRNDSRPEIQELARQVFDEKFPCQARNEIRAQLHIKNIVFHVRGEIYNEYGDEHIVNAEFTADTSGRIIKKLFDENDSFIEEKSVDIGVKVARKLFNAAVHHYDIPFWDTDLCRELSYDLDIDLLPEVRDDDGSDYKDELYKDEDLDSDAGQDDDSGGEAPKESIPTWSVEIKYRNGTEQSTKGYDYLPDPVTELFDEFDCYFEEDDLDDELP
ncbi:MAG: hypothetical protein LBQ71_04390 [Hungatella sp.]|jgi:hypothetical protein|nr:hypothetical protein [Hungatella sp.]